MMTDVPDIVEVVVGTALGTSDHCAVSYVLRVEQCLPEYNVRSTVFLTHRTNWDSLCSAFRRFSSSTTLKSADSLVPSDRANGEVIGSNVPTTALPRWSGDKHWFDTSCRRACDAKEAAYHVWCRARNEEHWGGVYAVARESHNECTRNILKHSTCSHNWWETLKGSIVGVKSSVPALRWFGGGPC